MGSLENSVVAKLSQRGEDFEIIVDPKLALDFKLGKKQDFNNVLIVEEVFSDAKKGDRQSADKLKKAFGTDDVSEIAQKIIKDGEVPITTEQRREMTEEKRKQVIALIAREAIDPRTNAPTPPVRIEKAMEESRAKIDPFKPAASQINDVLPALTKVLPLKFEKMQMAVKIPADLGQRLYGSFKGYKVLKEEWLSDGSLAVLVEIPAGIQSEFLNKINSMTSGRAQIKEVKK